MNTAAAYSNSSGGALAAPGLSWPDAVPNATGQLPRALEAALSGLENVSSSASPRHHLIYSYPPIQCLIGVPQNGECLDLQIWPWLLDASCRYSDFKLKFSPHCRPGLNPRYYGYMAHDQ